MQWSRNMVHSHFTLCLRVRDHLKQLSQHPKYGLWMRVKSPHHYKVMALGSCVKWLFECDGHGPAVPSGRGISHWHPFFGGRRRWSLVTPKFPYIPMHGPTMVRYNAICACYSCNIFNYFHCSLQFRRAHPPGVQVGRLVGFVIENRIIIPLHSLRFRGGYMGAYDRGEPAVSSGLCNLRFLKIYAQINKLTPSDVHKLSPLVLY